MRDHIGEGYKSDRKQGEGSFLITKVRFSWEKSSSPLFELSFIDPGLRTLILWRFWIQAHLIFQREYTFHFQSQYFVIFIPRFCN